jgi:hypothetical protein
MHIAQHIKYSEHSNLAERRGSSNYLENGTGGEAARGFMKYLEVPERMMKYLGLARLA